MTVEEHLDALQAATREVEQALHCLETEALAAALERRQACVDAILGLDPARLSEPARGRLKQALLDGERIRQHAAAQRDAVGGELAEVREARRRLAAARSGRDGARFVSTRA